MVINLGWTKLTVKHVIMAKPGLLGSAFSATA
jgi:hypothetical protein